MGEKDILERSLCAYNDVFSDIVNNLLFNGRELIYADKLENAVVHSPYQGEKAFRELERDIAKHWLDNDIRISLLGIENETIAEDDMPIRVIGYDGASYRDQISYEVDADGNRKKIVHKCPVVTLVLYFGYKNHWNMARSLHEALGEKLLPELKPFVSDYKINVFEIAWLTNEQVKGFKSDFRYVADYFVQMRSTGEYVGSAESIKHIREVLQLLGTLTGDNRFAATQEEKVLVGKEGGINTMEAWLDVIENRGIAQGEDRHLIDLICKKLRRGMDVEQIADEVEEDIVRVQMICNIAEQFSPDYELEDVFTAVEKELSSVSA